MTDFDAMEQRYDDLIAEMQAALDAHDADEIDRINEFLIDIETDVQAAILAETYPLRETLEAELKAMSAEDYGAERERFKVLCEQGAGDTHRYYRVFRDQFLYGSIPRRAPDAAARSALFCAARRPSAAPRRRRRGASNPAPPLGSLPGRPAPLAPSRKTSRFSVPARQEAVG